MIDIQTIYIRDVAKLTDVRFVPMVRIRDVDVDGLTSVILLVFPSST